MQRILHEDWTLVTNNWREFLARYKSRAPVHAGLLLFVAANGIEEQMMAFKLALDTVARLGLDLTNIALFVERDGDVLSVCQVDWPT